MPPDLNLPSAGAFSAAYCHSSAIVQRSPATDTSTVGSAIQNTQIVASQARRNERRRGLCLLWVSQTGSLVWKSQWD